MISILVFAKVWFVLRVIYFILNVCNVKTEKQHKLVTVTSYEYYRTQWASGIFFGSIWTYVLWWLIWGEK